MAGINYVNPNVKMLLYWIKERHSIYTKRQAGKPKPWTKDPILQTYRFCNVYRELDVVTKWISEVWRTPNDKDPNLWFAMVVARLINWPPTMAVLGYPCDNDTQWRSLAFTTIIHKIQDSGAKAYGGAYIVSTNGNAMDKAEYLADRVLTPLWKQRRDAPSPQGRGYLGTLNKMHEWLTQFDGLGSFMAAQVIADIKYSTPWREAPDWWTFAASGPGSRRGLNRILGYEVDNPWKEREWHNALTMLSSVLTPRLPAGMEHIHFQDLQNCLCEFDKYMRVKLGEGRPRSLYPGLR